MTDLSTMTDSTEAATTSDEGTVATSNDQTGGTDAGAEGTAQTGLDEAFLKGLESLDPSKIDPKTLPKTFNDRFIPKSEFTRKSQDLAEEKKAFQKEREGILDLARRVLADREKASGPTPQEVRKAELLELAAAGDKDAMRQVIRMEAEELVAPIRQTTSWATAAESARKADPAVVEHWDEIQNTIASQPVLAEMARLDNFKYADKVMLALGLEHKTWDQAKQLKVASEKITSLEQKIASYEKARVAGLPSSTSKAGTSTGSSSSRDFTSVQDAALDAWLAAGGRREDFR